MLWFIIKVLFVVALLALLYIVNVKYFVIGIFLIGIVVVTTFLK